MKPNNNLKEALDESNDVFLKYFVLIDSTEVLQNNRSMLYYLIPDMKIQKLVQWYETFSQSEQYSKKENRSKLESICSRFYGDGTLKILYKSLNQIIQMPYTEPDKVAHEKDIKKLIKKIALYIQQRLTDSDKEVVEEMFPALEEATTILSDKIDSDVLKSMTSAEEETEKEQEKQEEPKPEEESPEQTDGEPKKENKMSEYYRRRLNKKIREMVRSAIIDKKIKRSNNKA